LGAGGNGRQRCSHVADGTGDHLKVVINQPDWSRLAQTQGPCRWDEPGPGLPGLS
jgi:hypothetical protein